VLHSTLVLRRTNLTVDESEQGKGSVLHLV
jgi:hypothetical protein